MKAFFSGTDLKELEDNAKSYNFYISLIVSTDEQYVCKIIFPSKTTSVHEHLIKDFNGEVKKVKKEITENVLIDADLEVILNKTEVPEWISKRIKEVEAKKEVSNIKTKPWEKYNDGSKLGLPFGYEDDIYNHPVLPNKTYKPTFISLKDLLYLNEKPLSNSTIEGAIELISKMSKEELNSYIKDMSFIIDEIWDEASDSEYYNIIKDVIEILKSKKEIENIKPLLKFFEEEFELLN
jgi:hypothetical protein